MGALRISSRLWRITLGLPLPESLSATCTAACLFTPLVLVCFCLLALGPSSVGPVGRIVLCTMDFAAPALARASAASLYTMCVCVCVCARAHAAQHLKRLRGERLLLLQRSVPAVRHRHHRVRVISFSVHYPANKHRNQKKFRAR